METNLSEDLPPNYVQVSYENGSEEDAFVSPVKSSPVRVGSPEWSKREQYFEEFVGPSRCQIQSPLRETFTVLGRDYPAVIPGSQVEYCMVRGCGATMSSDGCSNPDCANSRPKYSIQESYRVVELGKSMGLAISDILAKTRKSLSDPLSHHFKGTSLMRAKKTMMCPYCMSMKPSSRSLASHSVRCPHGPNPVRKGSRMNNYIGKAMRTDNTYNQDLHDRLNARPFLRLLHCAMGLTTEVGELMDILKRHLFYGTDIDYVHIREEFGDLEWYKALGYDVLVDALSEEGIDRATIQGNVQQMNITKLSKRYPEKFTSHHAVNRDLRVERDSMEESCRPTL